jgi:hypothetical protein
VTEAVGVVVVRVATVPVSTELLPCSTRRRQWLQLHAALD